ncbi:MAG: sugar transferase [bacterium]
MKRLFDIIISFIGVILLSPLFFIIALIIRIDSTGPVIYKSIRMGKNKKPFLLHKFRTMYPNYDSFSITIGEKDPRITIVGYYLRKFKVDELPQLFDVLRGEMSIVGPRPDVPEYAEYYIHHMPQYFEMKPGITSFASIYFSKECNIYEFASDPEKLYVYETIPKKVELDKKYYNRQHVLMDLYIIFLTLKKLIFSR